MNFAFARRTELMLNVKLFRADIDLVNFTMLLPIVEIGAEAGPVALLFKGTSNVRPVVDSLRKSGDEQGEEEVGEPDGVEESEEEEEDIVGEEELASLSLESIFGDKDGDDVEVGGGIEGSNSDMVARLFLIRPMLKLSDSPDSDAMDALSTDGSPGIFFVSLFPVWQQFWGKTNCQEIGNQSCATISGSLLTPISHDTSGSKTWSHNSVVSMEFPAA